MFCHTNNISMILLGKKHEQKCSQTLQPIRLVASRNGVKQTFTFLFLPFYFCGTLKLTWLFQHFILHFLGKLCFGETLIEAAFYITLIGKLFFGETLTKSAFPKHFLYYISWKIMLWGNAKLFLHYIYYTSSKIILWGNAD